MSRAPCYDVVAPVSRIAVRSATAAPPLDDLSGKTIGELWDRVFKGDQMFPIIREELSKRYSGLRFVGYDTFGNTHHAGEAELIGRLPAMLREHGCDAVISAVGS